MKYFIILMILLSTLLFCQVSNATDIDWDTLIPAIIEVESGGDPNAISPKGAIGLMQITPIVLKEFNEVDIEWAKSVTEEERNGYPIDVYGRMEFYNVFRPDVNIMVGTWYLHRLQDHYGCDTIEKILMAYSAGITRCKKVGFDLKKLPKETRDYVKKVLKILKEEK